MAAVRDGHKAVEFQAHPASFRLMTADIQSHGQASGPAPWRPDSRLFMGVGPTRWFSMKMLTLLGRRGLMPECP